MLSSYCFTWSYTSAFTAFYLYTVRGRTQRLSKSFREKNQQKFYSANQICLLFVEPSPFISRPSHKLPTLAQKQMIHRTCHLWSILHCFFVTRFGFSATVEQRAVFKWSPERTHAQRNNSMALLFEGPIGCNLFDNTRSTPAGHLNVVFSGGWEENGMKCGIQTPSTNHTKILRGNVEAVSLKKTMKPIISSQQKNKQPQKHNFSTKHE